MSRQAAKVLASKEIEDVEGIKSVMNNLNVAGGTASAIPSGAAAGEVEDKKVILPFGTILPVHLLKEISSKTAKANDVFHGTIASDVNANGYILVPAGTPVRNCARSEGRRDSDWSSIADDRSRADDAELSRGTASSALCDPTALRQVSGGGTPAGSLLGTLTIKGPEVVASPDQVLRFRMLQPALVPVKLKGVRQVPPVPVEQTADTSKD